MTLCDGESQKACPSPPNLRPVDFGWLHSTIYDLRLSLEAQKGPQLILASEDPAADSGLKAVSFRQWHPEKAGRSRRKRAESRYCRKPQLQPSQRGFPKDTVYVIRTFVYYSRFSDRASYNLKHKLRLLLAERQCIMLNIRHIEGYGRFNFVASIVRLLVMLRTFLENGDDTSAIMCYVKSLKCEAAMKI